MFITIFSFLLCVMIVFGVESDYLPINWNISKERGNSNVEREYKYPMFQEIAPAPCDLTDSCDIFCQQDTDCSEIQKFSFATSEPDTQCNGPLTDFSCNCARGKHEKPEWFSLLCYIHRNPVYLGKFYKTPKKIKKFGVLNSMIAKKRRNTFINKENEGKIKSKINNLFGLPIMTFVPVSESFPSVSPLLIRTTLKDNSFACKTTPASYWVMNSIECLTRVTPELCQNGYVLSIWPFLVQDSNRANHSKIPVVLKDLNVLEGVQTEVLIKCFQVKSKTKKFNKNYMTYFYKENAKSCDDSYDIYHTVLDKNICKNVLLHVQYEFTLNGSDIIKLTVNFGLSDLVIGSADNFSDVISKYIYLKQKFDVIFYDVLTKSTDKRNYSRNDELLNRGYFVGEELNFGYLHTKNSSVAWEKGTLGMFKTGKSCDDFSPITFGFNYFSGCRIEKTFSNCPMLRSTVEEKFEALLKGEFLATYSNLRAPYNNSVPLLRSYSNSSTEDYQRNTTCYVPTVQDIIIQYTSILTETGKKIHRVLGIRVDRGFQNVSVDRSLHLTTRVFFYFVSSSKFQSTSRFWERMLSRESSENSWLYMFSAFDDVTPDEREEITFWCIFLIFLCCVAAACVKLDVNFDYFFL